MSDEWRNINDLYWVKPKKDQNSTSDIEDTNDIAEEEENDQPEVRLSDAVFVESEDGYQFNKDCTVQVTVEYLKDTTRNKVSFNLFCIYNDIEEDLGHQVVGYEKDGIAQAQMKLYYSDAYSDALRETPDAVCDYKFIARHSKGECEIESSLLTMPQNADSIDIQLEDPLEGVLKNITVTVTFSDNSSEEYTTDENGVLSITVEDSDYFDLEYTVGEGENNYQHRFLCVTEDAASPKGAWQRLVNMGYYSNSDPAIEPTDEDFETVLELFQSENGMEPTGEFDQTCKDKITEIYESEKLWGELESAELECPPTEENHIDKDTLT